MADHLEPIRRVFRNAGLYHHAADDLLCGELASAAAPPAALAAPAGWRVVWFTGSFKRGSERWEIYDPEGNGGAVDKADIRDDMVRGLLDALAAANKESTND